MSTEMWILLAVFTVFWLLLQLPIWIHRYFVIAGQRLPRKPEWRIVKYWDDDKADHRYLLQRVNVYNTGYNNTNHCGSEKWATRTVRHYKCEIIDEESLLDGEELTV